MSTIGIHVIDGAAPNEKRIVFDQIVYTGGPRAYYAAADAERDAEAAELFAINGVEGVIFVNNLCCVKKRDDVSWDGLLPPIESALRARWDRDHRSASGTGSIPPVANG